jgi:membrane-bound lytic murein transglycosylase F
MHLTGQQKKYFLLISLLVLLVSLSPLFTVLAIRLLNERHSIPYVSSCQDDIYKPYTETGDLNFIKKHKTLRFIISKNLEHFPAVSQSEDFHSEPQKELIEGLCDKFGFKYVFIQGGSTAEIISLLLKGRADIVIGSLSELRNFEKDIAFSLPIFPLSEVIVGKKGAILNSTAELQDKTLAFTPQPRLAETAYSLKKRFNSIKLKSLPLFLTTDEILDLISYGDTDYCLVDGYSFNQVGDRRADVEVVFDFQNNDSIIWAIRPTNEELVAHVNGFLRNYMVQNNARLLEKREDMPQILKSGRLCFVTLNEKSSYYIWKGEKCGFEYELAKSFASRYGLNFQVVPVADKKELFSFLLSGKGDIAGAFITRSEVSAIRGLAPSFSYNRIFTYIVGGDVNRPCNLSQGEITVIGDSQAHRTLKIMQSQGAVINIKIAEGAIHNQESLLSAVAKGQIKMVAIEDRFYQLLAHNYTNLTILSELPVYEEQCWAIKEKNLLLTEAVNEFLNKNFKLQHIHALYQKYFVAESNRQAPAFYSEQDISPYDLLIRYYARQNSFDWRLIASIVYQESRFNPDAISKAGACGLMQIMPAVAENYGFSDIHDPAVNINLGTKHLASIYQLFPEHIDQTNRLCLALAAYYSGIEHVIDARKLAKALNKNPDVWKNNVESAFILLSDPTYYRSARTGYCDGDNCIDYVNAIMHHYADYQKSFP